MKTTLLSILAIIFGATVSVAQTTLFVPGTYATIQDAVNASTHPLDVVEVAAGTFSGAVNISKSLSIHGPNLGVAGTGVRGAEANVSDSKITVSGAVTVNIDGLRILQTNNTADAVSLGGSSAVTLQNCIIERNAVTPNIIARGVVTSAGTGSKTIKTNLFTGDVSGGLFSGHKTWYSGIYINGASSTVMVQNNTFRNCRTAINNDDFNSGITISGNVFDNNGTHMSFGGVTPTAGQYVLPANILKNPADAIINLSNVNINFRLDITACTFNGVPFSTYPLANLFQIEQGMYHRNRSGRKGLVTYVPNNQYVIPVNPSIQAAIDYAVVGHIIHVAPGTYTENLNVNLKVNILGSGSGSDPSANTLLTQTGGGLVDTKVGVIQLIASGTGGDPILIKDIRVLPKGMAGISVGKFTLSTGANVSHVALDNVHVYGTFHIDPCTEQERGLYVDKTSSLSNLTITNSAFNGLDYGWYLQKEVSADASTVTQVSVSSTEFKDNVSKGLYAEKLDNATFDGCSIINNGDAGWGNTCVFFKAQLAGFDINLKAGTYQNITIRNSVFTGNGTGEAKEGVALMIKARNDAPAYSTFTANLNNVLVENNILTDNERGVRTGEPNKGNSGPTNVVIRNNSINGNTKQYSGSDGSAYGNVINMTTASVLATCNWFGSNDPSAIAPGIFGNVTFMPTLQDGNDGSVAIGFQPTAACGQPPACTMKAVCDQQGLTHSGGAVPATRSDAAKAEVAQKTDVNGTINFYSLGYGGTITLKSSCPVNNGPGNDIKVWETTYGAQVVNANSDRARVYASQNGVNFLYLGMATFDGAFDLNSVGLSWAQYFRIVDATVDFAGNTALADGYDVDGIEVLNGYTNDVAPEPDPMVGAASVCGGIQGKTKAFGDISPIRSDPSKATGLPQNNDTYNFYALGFGGDICLKFDFAIFDAPGIDLKLVETTFGNQNCNAYKEQAEISVSFNGIDWNVLTSYCQDNPGDIDITPANSGIQYVRIRDISNRADFTSPFADGFDVDAVVHVSGALTCPPILTQGRVAFEGNALFDQIQVPDELEALQLITNPVSSQINLRFSMVSEKASINLYNQMGQNLSAQNLEGKLWDLKEISLPASQLAPGVYFISVDSGVQKETIKFVKN